MTVSNGDMPMGFAAGLLRAATLPIRHRWRVLLLAWLGLAMACAAGAAEDTLPLRGEWRPAGSEADWTPFDPSSLSRLAGSAQGADIRLWTVGSAASTGDWVLVVHTGPLDRLRFRPPAGATIEAGLMDAVRHDWIGYGRIGFPLRALPPADAPLELTRIPQQVIGGSLAFSLLPRSVFLAEEVRWVALLSVCFALLGGMAVVALVFAARLRDATFLWYAGYLSSYALIQLLQTGYVASPLGWTLLLEAPRAWGRVAVVASIAMIVLFLVRFAELRRYAPRTVRPLQAYVVAIIASAVLGWLPIEAVQAASRAAINPLLIIGGPLLLGVALRAWWRGSRYAGFFVVGWTPLLLVTVAGSLQMFGLFGRWLDEGQAPLVAAAFEALVLSVGLADRIALVRRDRDLARAQADTDPLTAVLNRRALDRGLAGLCRGGSGGEAVAVLYCDLDHFKRLNDSQGHAVGDEALRAVAEVLAAELRPRDLIGRMGGEEFVIVLPRCTADAARAVAERLRAQVRALGAPPRFGPQPLTISIGVAAATCPADAAALLAQADHALYAAKAAGRDRVMAFAAA